jgi:hypothetical protein
MPINLNISLLSANSIKITSHHNLVYIITVSAEQFLVFGSMLIKLFHILMSYTYTLLKSGHTFQLEQHKFKYV